MTALALAALLVLVALNGVFVAAEFALVRARRGKIEELAAEGDSSGRAAVLEQIEQIDEYLSTGQLGITMASIGIGFLGEPAIATLIEPAFGGPLPRRRGRDLRRDRLRPGHARSTSPSASRSRRSSRSAARKAPPGGSRRTLELFRTATTPFTVALTWISNSILRLFGIRPGDIEEKHTSDDLKMIISPLGGGRRPRPGRGGDAEGRLPSPRAGGARGDDADPRGRDGGRHGDGRGRAAGSASPPATLACS